MKVTKKVVNGVIDITIEDAPILPSSTRILHKTGSGYVGAKLELLPTIEVLQYGDFRHSPRLDEGYRKDESAEKIVVSLSKRFDRFQTELSKFINEHTETAKIENPEQLISSLYENEQILYRGKDGKIRKLY